MTPRTEDAPRPDGGQLTVLVSTAATDPDTCVEVLRDSGVTSTVERFDFANGEPLVQALVPCGHRPSADDVEAAKRTVSRVLEESGIEHEVRGTGFDVDGRV